MIQESRLTQNFLGLSDDAFRAVPVLQKALTSTINTHLDEHHSSTGTVMTALACVVGELTLASGTDAQVVKAKFLEILDAYTNSGIDGARVGPSDEPSLIRTSRPWRG